MYRLVALRSVGSLGDRHFVTISARVVDIMRACNCALETSDVGIYDLETQPRSCKYTLYSELDITWSMLHEKVHCIEEDSHVI